MINTLWLVLGYACNNRCQHCYVGANVSKNNKWMNIDFAKKVIATLKKEGLKECLLIGGEPTLYPNLTDIISFGSDLGIKMVIISNGRKFSDTEFAKQIFSSGLNRAVISVEGATKSVHNLLTGCDSFQETVKGIEKCARLGQVNTLTTVCKDNALQLINMIENAYSLGAKKAVLNCAIPVVLESSIVAEQCLDPVELAEVISSLFLEAKRRDLSFSLNATFPICLLQKEVLEEMLILKWISVGCHMYRGKGIVIDFQGNILPCTHFSDAPLIESIEDSENHFKLKDSLREIWNDPNSVVGKFRSSLWRYPAKKCVKCTYWGGCIGGCPLLWTHFNPEIFIDRKTERR